MMGDSNRVLGLLENAGSPSKLLDILLAEGVHLAIDPSGSFEGHIENKEEDWRYAVRWQKGHRQYHWTKLGGYDHEKKSWTRSGTERDIECPATRIPHKLFERVQKLVQSHLARFLSCWRTADGGWRYI